MSLIGPRPCPNCGGMVPEGAMLAHICRRPSSSNSEALRMLQRLDGLYKNYGEGAYKDAADMIRALLARADKDNAAGRVTGNSSLNSSSMENRLDLPAPAAPSDDALPIHEHPAIKDAQKVLATAPAEAPTPRMWRAPDEQVETLVDRELAVWKWVQQSARTNADHTVLVTFIKEGHWSYLHGDPTKELKSELSAALSRERLANEHHAEAERLMAEARIAKAQAEERARLANMRADQAEEAREAAQRDRDGFAESCRMQDERIARLVSATPAIDTKALAVIDAARNLISAHKYITGMSDDNPFKGNGNRLADAVLAYDSAIASSSAKEGKDGKA